MSQDDDRTAQADGFRRWQLPQESFVRGFRLQLLEGAQGGPTTWEPASDRCTIGSNERNDVVLADRTVSRFHAEIRLDERGARIRDLGSTNGTLLDGVPVVEAWLREGSVLRLGDSVLRFGLLGGKNALALSRRTRFGGLVGRSVAMRSTFAQLERAATTDSTVLLRGETGTGKEEAAQALHEASARADGPFVVVDCSTVVPTLVESELFGYERGAFTGAEKARAGAFEQAHGGTVFLDEVGELPLELQPRLLRILENRQVRRVGGNQSRAVDVRVIAATHRDLRAGVNSGSFREDLYYRLAVIEIELPPLRNRPEDLPILIDTIIERLDPEAQTDWLDRDALVERLSTSAWPGNVRQLRNYLAQCVAFKEAPSLSAPPSSSGTPLVSTNLPYEEARRVALEAFERQYATALLEKHKGNVSEAARSAGLNRTYLHRLIRRHRVRGE
ncbi:MAG: sigma 54-interacting transcriptional regulator [Deltaproteobacteria bacterium]|nr:sigma 54-interacting transcriptional regulator [Deltaproteobacteria bacterium]